MSTVTMRAAEPPPTRPALRWHGGKWLLAPWIIAHMPPHRRYVEPFGGAASVLLRKGRAHGEVYNDLDDEVVLLFRVLRNPVSAVRLLEALRLTPYARAEFDDAYRATTDPVERARRLVVRSFMGFGSDGFRTDVRTSFRANSNRSGTTPSRDWANLAEALPQLIGRLQGVVIENRPALDCMAQHDGADTLHYVDPPYLPATRRITHRNHGYRHELSTEQHWDLLQRLRKLRGMVILSGYPSSTYDDNLVGWRRITSSAYADGARRRTEVLWLNPAASARAAQRDIFG